jgi:hypothetical protein
MVTTARIFKLVYITEQSAAGVRPETKKIFPIDLTGANTELSGRVIDLQKNVQNTAYQ